MRLLHELHDAGVVPEIGHRFMTGNSSVEIDLIAHVMENSFPYRGNVHLKMLIEAKQMLDDRPGNPEALRVRT